MSIETSFLYKLVETGDFDTVDELKISQKYLFGKNRRAFKWIVDFKTKYGKVPSIYEFEKKFPDIKIEEVNAPEPLRFYCDELRNKLKHNTIVESMEESQKLLNEFETSAAYNILKKMILTVENEIIVGDTRRINQDTEKRWEAYLERRNSGGIIGIPTGMKPFDLITGGLGETDFIGILGFTNVGKTWFILILAVLLAQAGYKVLFVTREMGTDQVMKRADAIWANISYTDFNKGRLSPQQEEIYKKYLQEMKAQMDESLIVELATGGISNLAALCDRHNPQVLIVDGLYLMTDDSDDKEWRGLVETTRGAKQVCLSKKIPTIATFQLTANKASLTNISFAKAIAQDFDVIFGMEQTEEMKNDKEVRFKPLKLRDSDVWSTFVLNWDFHAMDYSPVYIENVKPENKEIPTGKVQQLED
jgi:replicative DNA helicase